ncbi:MAG: diguanylate cyclase [Nitrococcus sp.]|nr:diguanylate cyclase [Nitrococcus sp.]
MNDPVGRAPRLRKAVAVARTRWGLPDSAVFYAAALEALPDAVLILDQAGSERAHNRKFAELWRIPAGDDRVPTLARIAAAARTPGTFLAQLQAISSTTGAEGSGIVELQDGRVVEFCSASHRINGIRVGSVLSFRDVTAAKRAEAILRHRASHDPLTGLPNRALLLDRCGQAIKHARRHEKQLALLFIDLDRFSHVNAACGHAGGDQVLFETARRLLRCVRRGDTVARLGGDEFVVLLAQITTREDAAGVAGRILQALTSPFGVAGRRIFIDASIGIGLYPEHARNAETLIARADYAMYRVKANGGSSYRIGPPATTPARTQTRWPARAPGVLIDRGTEAPMTDAKEAILWLDLTQSRNGYPAPEVARRFSVHRLQNTRQVDSAVRDVRPRMACLEYDVPDSPGLVRLGEMRVAHPQLPIVVISAHYSLVLGVYARRAQVLDYIVNPTADALYALLVLSKAPSADGSVMQVSGFREHLVIREIRTD